MFYIHLCGYPELFDQHHCSMQRNLVQTECVKSAGPTWSYCRWPRTHPEKLPSSIIEKVPWAFSHVSSVVCNVAKMAWVMTIGSTSQWCINTFLGSGFATLCQRASHRSCQLFNPLGEGMIYYKKVAYKPVKWEAGVKCQLVKQSFKALTIAM